MTNETIKIVREFDASRIPPPRTTTVFKPIAGPIDVEIGAGVGYHPLQYAKQNSARTIYAIERTKERFSKLHKRYIAHGEPENLIPVRSDAVSWITHQVPPKSIDRYFILYPNPYPKSLNRHWAAMPFFAQILHTLKPQGTITLATNISTYANESVVYMERQWRLKILEFRQIEKNAIPRTHFEKKYLARGESCWNIIAQKAL